MQLDDYQRKAGHTACYPKDAQMSIIYPTLGLVGEAGEFADKIKKIIRRREQIPKGTDAVEIIKELGDVLWYVAAIATELEWDLSQVAVLNLDKINDRKARGAIKGEGDNR